jgi:hypothetical protein
LIAATIRPLDPRTGAPTATRPASNSSSTTNQPSTRAQLRGRARCARSPWRQRLAAEQRVERGEVVVEQQRAARRGAVSRNVAPGPTDRADRVRRLLGQQREHLASLQHGQVGRLAEV